MVDLAFDGACWIQLGGMDRRGGRPCYMLLTFRVWFPETAGRDTASGAEAAQGV